MLELTVIQKIWPEKLRVSIRVSACNKKVHVSYFATVLMHQTIIIHYAMIVFLNPSILPVSRLDIYPMIEQN